MLASLRQSDPESYRLLCKALISERERLQVKLQSPAIHCKIEEFKVRLKLWVLRGVLEHDIAMSQLKKIAKRYSRIGRLPQEYNQPELYQVEPEEEESKGQLH